MSGYRWKKRWTTNTQNETNGSSYHLTDGDPTKKYYIFYGALSQADTKGRFDHVYTTGHQGPPYNSGGFFLQVSQEDSLKTDILDGRYYYNWQTQYVLDNVVINQKALPAQAVSTSMGDPWSVAVDAGTSGVARYAPSTKVYDFGVALGEARQLPQFPKLLERRHLNLRSAGSDYLNVEFGWKPFLRDLEALANIQEKIDKKLRQLRRDNGQSVRRRGTILSEDFSEEGNLTSAPYPYNLVRATSTPTWKNTIKNERWFSAKFKIFIPDLGEPQWVAKNFRNLTGTELTPDLLWNLIPYSWLHDWFSNVGAVIENASYAASDGGIRMEYGYGMAKSVRRTETFLPWESKNPKIPGSGIIGAVRERTFQVRLPAFPYMFSVTPPSLSPKQAAILGALGLSNSNL